MENFKWPNSIMAIAYIIRKIYKKFIILLKLMMNIQNSNVKIAMINSDFKLKNEINIVEFFVRYYLIFQ